MDTQPTDVEDEYSNWRVNTTLLYDAVISHRLVWPSLTLQCFPADVFPNGFPNIDKQLELIDEEEDEDDVLYQYVLLGTHTSGGEPNELFVARVTLPKTIESKFKREYSEQSDYSGFPYGNECVNKFQIAYRIPHEGEPNRIRYCPQNYRKVATKTVCGDVCVFSIDDNSPSSMQDEGFEKKRDLVLKGHKKEGFGLSWNQRRMGFIASVANDGYLCLWDINSAAGSDVIQPLVNVESHEMSANEIVWSEDSDNIVITCGDDKLIKLWDFRQRNKLKASMKVKGGKSPINSLSICSQEPFVMASASDDNDIKLWDFRRFTSAVHTVDNAHDDGVTSVLFSPHRSGLLLSTSVDRFVKLWDIKKIGKEQSEEDEEAGPSELIFSHGGHTAPVSDIAWSSFKHYPMMALSVSEDNAIQIWHPKMALIETDSESESDSDDDDSDVE